MYVCTALLLITSVSDWTMTPLGYLYNYADADGHATGPSHKNPSNVALAVSGTVPSWTAAYQSLGNFDVTVPAYSYSGSVPDMHAGMWRALVTNVQGCQTWHKSPDLASRTMAEYVLEHNADPEFIPISSLPPF